MIIILGKTNDVMWNFRKFNRLGVLDDENEEANKITGNKTT